MNSADALQLATQIQRLADQIGHATKALAELRERRRVLLNDWREFFKEPPEVDTPTRGPGRKKVEDRSPDDSLTIVENEPTLTGTLRRFVRANQRIEFTIRQFMRLQKIPAVKYGSVTTAFGHVIDKDPALRRVDIGVFQYEGDTGTPGPPRIRRKRPKPWLGRATTNAAELRAWFDENRGKVVGPLDVTEILGWDPTDRQRGNALLIDLFNADEILRVRRGRYMARASDE